MMIIDMSQFNKKMKRALLLQKLIKAKRATYLQENAFMKLNRELHLFFDAHIRKI